MKKIMIAAAIVCAAAFAQAAAVDWSASAVVDPWATAAAGKNTPANGWVGYMIMSASLDAITTDLANGDTSSLISAAVGPVKHTTNKGAFNLETASGNVAAGAQDFYMIVLNAATADAATYFYVSQKVTATIDASLDSSVAFLSQAANSKVVGNWAEIAPEPTSGLMMLFGLGVLALRRRRA